MEAQTLTLAQAIQEALSKNYDIQVAQSQVQIAKNQATRGQAGLLPTISASGAYDFGLDNTKLQVAGQPDAIETDGAQSSLFSASLNASYTIWSGRSNINTYEKLLLNEELATAQSRLQVENIVMQVISAYYNVLRTKDNYASLKESLELSQDRLKLAQKKYELSGGPKINILSAKVDLNKDSVNIRNALQTLDAAKINLNALLERNLDEELNLQYDENAREELIYSDLLQKMNAQNPNLQSSRYAEQISMLDYKISKSAYSPRLNLNPSYGYSRLEAEGNFLELNQSNGLGILLQLSVPIYNGGVRKANAKNAKIAMENSALQKKQIEINTNSKLFIAFKDYERAKEIVSMEAKNVMLTKENYNYTKTQFELGLVSNLELRQAQVNLLLTQNNLNNMRYNLRLSELELKRLSGGLVTD
jgi:outer membrane protein TolC